jgi:hypothetical protein
MIACIRFEVLTTSFIQLANYMSNILLLITVPNFSLKTKRLIGVLVTSVTLKGQCHEMLCFKFFS